MLRTILFIILVTVAMAIVTSNVKVETISNTNIIEKLIERREMIENF